MERVRFVAAAFLGAVLIYCGHEVVGRMEGGPDGGAVPSAGGQTPPSGGGSSGGGACCAMPSPVAETLIDGPLMFTFQPFADDSSMNSIGAVPCNAVTEAREISGYQWVTLHIRGCDHYDVQYRLGAAGFVSGERGTCSSFIEPTGRGNEVQAANSINLQLTNRRGREVRVLVSRYRRDAICDQPVSVTMVGYK